MKVALVGTGYIAGRHATALAAMGDIEIVGHVDVVPEGAQKAAETYGGRAYASLDDLLAHEQVEAVWVCVPPFAHGAVERTCIAHNLPMYIEKPVGSDAVVPEAIAEELSRHQDLVVNVGYYWRVMEGITELKQALAAAPPRLVRLSYHGPTPPAAWWQTHSKSGGQIVEQATHFFDLARYLVGDATVLYAQGTHFKNPEFPAMDVDNVTLGGLQFSNGALGAFTATCVLHATVDAGMEFYSDGRKISLTRERITYEDASGTREVPITKDALVTADEQFIAAVRAKNPQAVPCTYEEGLKSHHLCRAISARARQAEPVA